MKLNNNRTLANKDIKRQCDNLLASCMSDNIGVDKVIKKIYSGSFVTIQSRCKGVTMVSEKKTPET